MEDTPISLVIVCITASAFLVYGLQIFVSRLMAAEYKRYGMTGWQMNMIGFLQVSGSIALVIGVCYPYLGLAAAVGFVLMMSIALWVRWKLRDNLKESLPALILLGSSIWLCTSYFHWINS